MPRFYSVRECRTLSFVFYGAEADAPRDKLDVVDELHRLGDLWSKRASTGGFSDPRASEPMPENDNPPPIDPIAALDRLQVLAASAKSDYQNAWRNIRETLDEAAPGWRNRSISSLNAACETIKDLAKKSDADGEERVPFAWSYKLARAIASDGTYYNWDSEPRLSLYKPCVPEGSIRELRPMYLGDEE